MCVCVCVCVCDDDTSPPWSRSLTRSKARCRELISRLARELSLSLSLAPCTLTSNYSWSLLCWNRTWSCSITEDTWAIYLLSTWYYFWKSSSTGLVESKAITTKYTKITLYLIEGLLHHTILVLLFLGVMKPQEQTVHPRYKKVLHLTFKNMTQTVIMQNKLFIYYTFRYVNGLEWILETPLSITC